MEAASVLEEFAAGAPEGDRFKLHFAFAIDAPDPAFGPATLAYLSLLLQGHVMDGYGRLPGCRIWATWRE